ncbi:MAG: N-acetylmuramoyl-L-alanine amidase [Deltaproteobacteria bacterium]|nr:N-acetylmuramoyl-L-alanine amidase [Deltaproteobacteria bacterium]
MKRLFILLIIVPWLSHPLQSYQGKSRKKTPAKPLHTLTIVIDPGHGGKDSGAIGAGERQEKKVALQIARILRKKLEKKLGAKVVMTRNGDQFVSLGERNRISKRAKADLFISIHANASTRKRPNGLEIYYLNNATDRASQKLAARENEGLTQEEKETEAILSTLIQNESTEESAVLAKEVRKALFVKIRGTRDLGVKTALFYVLVGPGCPSLLIETGFITNPEEGRKLMEHRYQEALAEGILLGLNRYLQEAKKPRSNL